MLLIVMSICLGIFAIAALVMMTAGTGTSKRATLRLAALSQEFASTSRVFLGKVFDFLRKIDGGRVHSLFTLFLPARSECRMVEALGSRWGLR